MKSEKYIHYIYFKKNVVKKKKAILLLGDLSLQKSMRGELRYMLSPRSTQKGYR